MMQYTAFVQKGRHKRSPRSLPCQSCVRKEEKNEIRQARPDKTIKAIASYGDIHKIL